SPHAAISESARARRCRAVLERNAQVCAGSVRRRTKVTKLTITGPDGRSETETVIETLERRLISRRGPGQASNKNPAKRRGLRGKILLPRLCSSLCCYASLQRRGFV